MPLLDLHVHIAGIGRGGTGCYAHPAWLRRLPIRLLRRIHEIPPEEVDLDLALRERLASHLADAPDLRVVVLALDWARDASGAPLPELTDLHIPNDYILALARENPSILPGVSIHPFRADAIDELARTAEAGAVLVKWLPTSQNFSPADPRCRPFYTAMARWRIPLLCHTGSEGATRTLDPAWNDPRTLIPALEAGVTVIAAHAGMRSSPHDRDYSREWLAMLTRYPHLYGDTASWFGLRARRALSLRGDGAACERLVHGSDWPIPASPWWFLGALPIRAILRLHRIRNPLLRDLETKRALGLPDEVFTRGWTLLRREISR